MNPGDLVRDVWFPWRPDEEWEPRVGLVLMTDIGDGQSWAAGTRWLTVLWKDGSMGPARAREMEVIGMTQAEGE